MLDLRMLKIVSYSVLSPLIILANVFVLAVIVRSKALRAKPHTVFVVSLIATHLIQGVVVMPTYIMLKSKGSVYLCDIFRMSYLLTFYGACLNVLLITFDRLMATKFVFSYKRRVKRSYYVWLTFAVWAYMLALCVLPFFHALHSDRVVHSKCSYIPPKEWTIYNLVVNCLLVYVTVLLMYCYIIRLLRQSARKTKENNSPHKQSQQLKVFYIIAKIRGKARAFSPRGGEISSQQQQNNNIYSSDAYDEKLTRFTLKICVFYGISWAPSVIYYLLINLDEMVFSEAYYQSRLEAVITFTCKFITLFDGLTAPALYCYGHVLFRSEAKRVLRGLKSHAYNT